jgi:hypothetical protein
MNKRLKILLGLLAAAVIIGGVYFLAMKPGMSSSDMATTTAETATTSMPAGTKAGMPARGTTAPATGAVVKPGTITSSPVPPAPAVHWSFIGHSPNNVGQTSTDVTVTVGDKVLELGTFLGKCETIADEDLKSSNEISGVTCLEGGKGMEIGVFRSGTKFLVQKGDIEVGDARTPSKRGSFVTVETI